MDHGLRARDEIGKRSTIGEITGNPVHAVAARLRLAGQRLDDDALVLRLVDQRLADKAGAARNRDGHSRINWSRCTTAERGA